MSKFYIFALLLQHRQAVLYQEAQVSALSTTTSAAQHKSAANVYRLLSPPPRHHHHRRVNHCHPCHWVDHGHHHLESFSSHATVIVLTCYVLRRQNPRVCTCVFFKIRQPSISNAPQSDKYDNNNYLISLNCHIYLILPRAAARFMKGKKEQMAENGTKKNTSGIVQKQVELYKSEKSIRYQRRVFCSLQLWVTPNVCVCACMCVKVFSPLKCVVLLCKPGCRQVWLMHEAEWEASPYRLAQQVIILLSLSSS